MKAYTSYNRTSASGLLEFWEVYAITGWTRGVGLISFGRKVDASFSPGGRLRAKPKKAIRR
jgi:hypothetical protein